MSKKIIIYFAVSGLALGIFNSIDSFWGVTGGYDIPRSMVINLPTLMAQERIVQVINEIESARIKKLNQKLKLDELELIVSGEKFGNFTPEEKEIFVGKMVQSKRQVRDDFLVGQDGILSKVRNIVNLYFPVLSAIVWGALGFIIYTIGVLLNLLNLRVIKNRARKK